MLEEEIEALLFLHAREISLRDIAKILMKREPEIMNAIGNLKQRYESTQSSLALRKIGENYSLNVKQEYAEKLKDVIKKREISSRELRVLALLKKNENILKSQVIKALGATFYETIAELIEKGFVKTIPVGRSARLSLTEKFKDYFGEI